ncbi:hypothetical protein [Streptomyces jeddahensis]|uniref:DUF3592 domain-containing protein n=1 Tax=Streptomyces jeddahensis TaxID=1716141 RepID=A0A177HID9_9ACTN|nr:hypothetical protein [Streptomyces jeddahensis]OAH10721.1 hypothetical protein STSP_59600 [Streptomyces jeddahensis]
MNRETIVPVNFKSAQRVGQWSARLGFVAGAVVFMLWFFSSEPTLRRQAILVSLACAILSVVAVALYQRKIGGPQPFSVVAAGEFAGANEDTERCWLDSEATSLPRRIPSRRRQLLRSFAGAVGVWSVFVGLIAMAWGSPQRPELVERIHSAGAVFAEVQVDKVSDVRFRDPSKGKSYYTATTLVQLPDAQGGEPVPATVTTESYDRLSPGDRVSVLYAPTQPRLGAVAGDESDLENALRGATLPTRIVWLLLVGWGLGLCGIVALMFTAQGFRTFSRLGTRDRAIRGKIVRVAQFSHAPTEPGKASSKSQSLSIETATGHVHFLVDIRAQDLPESVTGQPVCLCWDARRGVAGRRFSPRVTPAALISDQGWVMHGMLAVSEGRLLADVGTPVQKLSDAPSGGRMLRLWDPHSKWALFVSPLTLGLLVAIIACAALMTFDVATGWRWAVGIASPLMSMLLAGSFLMTPGQSDEQQVPASRG